MAATMEDKIKNEPVITSNGPQHKKPGGQGPPHHQGGGRGGRGGGMGPNKFMGRGGLFNRNQNNRQNVQNPNQHQSQHQNQDMSQNKMKVSMATSAILCFDYI